MPKLELGTISVWLQTAGVLMYPAFQDCRPLVQALPIGSLVPKAYMKSHNIAPRKTEPSWRKNGNVISNSSSTNIYWALVYSVAGRMLGTGVQRWIRQSRWGDRHICRPFQYNMASNKVEAGHRSGMGVCAGRFPCGDEEMILKLNNVGWKGSD